MKEPAAVKTRAKRRVRRPLPPVPGGKALARLHQFELERALDADGATPRPKGATARVRGRAARLKRADLAAPKPETVGEAYAAAFRDVLRSERLTPAVPVPQLWQPIGPYAVPHGQTYGSGPGSRPAVAGRVSSVAVDPVNGAHVLIGAAGGGVWESTDEGRTWQPRTDNQPSLATGSIAFAPSNTTIVYAGTGEGDFFAWLGAGILRSTDGGTTWALRAGAPFLGLGFYDIAVDPLNADHVLAGTTGGLFESTDGGATWTRRRTQRTWKVSYHPAPVGGGPSPEVLAACADGTVRSTNGGTTWTVVALPGAPAAWTRIEVCHAPSDGNIAYVFACGSTGTAHAWRRDVFAGAFAAVALPAIATGQAWYDWFAAAAPNNPDVLYLGEIEVHRGVRDAAGTWTWTKISARGAGDSIHPDQHAIAFGSADPNVVFIGNDGGVYRSPDAGTTWQSLNKGLAITEFEYLAQHPQYDAWLLGGTQDNGTLRYEGEEIWYHVQDGDGGDCGINSANPHTSYHTFFGMGMERSTSGGAWGTWAWIGPNPPATHQQLFYPPLETNGALVAQAGSSVFLSRDSGNTWTEVALPSGIASALSAPSATRVYVGTTVGDVYRVDFTAGSWQAPVALTRPRVGYVSDLLADASLANRIWATFATLAGSHVFRSDDGGTTWIDVSGGLPSIPVNAIEVDPTNPSTVWIAADVGVHRTTDAGASWAPFSAGLPNALVKDLLLHPTTRLLRAATQSRGVWEIPVDQAQMPTVQVYLRDSVVDTGRRTPSPSGVASPFELGATTYWWQCTDIKVDAPSYQTANLGDVDFERFEDDHGVFAAGLTHESAQRGRTARVYVHVHNRGSMAATNIAVKGFFADASAGLPDLPAGFWTNFPNNVLPAGAPWQAIAPHVTIPSIASGRGEIAGFSWSVPSSAADHTCLLVVTSAANDTIATAELRIGTLVPNEPKCGLKNLVVVNPPPAQGPVVRTLVLKLWPTRRVKRYALGGDRGIGAFVRGVVLPASLARVARKEGRKTLKLTAEMSRELSRLRHRYPSLEKQLTGGATFAIPSSGPWLSSFALDGSKPSLVVLLLNGEPRAGSASVIQWSNDGTPLGGLTLHALP